ncbi:MAG: hypothetical protein J7J27_04695 [Euryarchaeota archaeon]|nr:hypothetical protein [Euryarchaeota archaeon]
MIVAVVDSGSRAINVARKYVSMGLDVLLSFYGSPPENMDNLDNIHFLGKHRSPEDALLELISFLDVNDSVLFHIMSNYTLTKNDIKILNSLLSSGYSAVFFYYFPDDSVYRNFLYPVIGGCIGRPIPPPTAPFALRDDFYLTKEDFFSSSTSFSYAYNIVTFIEVSTTFEPSAGVYVSFRDNLPEGSYVHSLSAYLEYFPRWSAFEGEHRIPIIGLDKIVPKKPKGEMMTLNYPKILERIIVGEITFQDIKGILGEPLELSEMEYQRVQVLRKKDDIISAIRRASKVLF